MNRLILKYAYPITFAILAVLAWVVYRIFSAGGTGLIGFVAVIVIAWGLGAFVFIYFWPRFTYSAYKRAIVQHGISGPIPVNTLYASPTLSSPAASNASLLATGSDDVLYIGGWLDLSKGPQILQVPDMAGRYYSVQFTDPSNGANFAYVGKRATGTAAGEYLISGPGWKGTMSPGMTRIVSASDSDLPIAYGLAQQIQLTPLSP
jgi:hypothetical protein